MGRYDKYDPKVGGFRAPLAAVWDSDDIGKVLGVGLDTNGRVVVGAGQTGIVGVIVLTMVRNAGDIVDVMTGGEIVQFGPSDAESVPGTDFGAAGTVYFSDDDGLITDTSAEGSTRVGHTVEGQRLIVRVEQTTVPGAVTWAGIKPQGGIPKTDLAAAVGTSLDKADSAYQLPEGGIPGTDIAIDAVDSDQIKDGAVDLDKLSATGTPSGSNYLKGDNTWGTVT